MYIHLDSNCNSTPASNSTRTMELEQPIGMATKKTTTHTLTMTLALAIVMMWSSKIKPARTMIPSMGQKPMGP